MAMLSQSELSPGPDSRRNTASFSSWAVIQLALSTRPDLTG